MDASILIVHYGDPNPTIKCIRSIYKSDVSGKDVEIILIDNNRDTSQKQKFLRKFTKVKYIKSKKNNYCHALNIGIKKSKGKFIVILNPDTIVDKNWIKEILIPFKNKKVAGVSSKILFKKSKKINSLGIEEIDDYYYQDIGMNEEDDDTLKTRTIKYASGCSTAYRKKALEEAGYFDEDFTMYVEDVDMGIKLRKKGWKIMMNPKSVVYHAFHGTTGEIDLASYFCNRNRFLIIAKHHPHDFSKQIKKSHSYINKRFNELYDSLKVGIIKLFKSQKESVVKKELPKIIKKMADIYPLDKVRNLINEIELYFGLRKPSVCIYDHALHFIGGGQKYGCSIAEAVQKDLDTTLIANKKIKIQTLEKWYEVNLKKCDLKIINLPINKKDDLINPSLAENATKNPFSIVEDEVLNYDILINVNMVPHVNALALKSIFLCHFPDGKKRNFFYPSNYDKIITNSKYTTEWMKKRWNIDTDEIIYPPVDMKYGKKIKKEKIILSVSRFEESGSKRQLELAKIFNKLCKKYPKIGSEWKLILAGGTMGRNTYLQKIKNYVRNHNVPIKILTNLSNNELKKLYAKSKIFWHACGLNQNRKKNPNLIEHFGMTTVEAMQNGCVPVVINGGGQKEIIEHGVNGFRFNNKSQLKHYTLQLIKREKTFKKIQKEAKKTSSIFNKKLFQQKFIKIINEFKKDLIDEKNYFPEIHDIYLALR